MWRSEKNGFSRSACEHRVGLSAPVTVMAHQQQQQMVVLLLQYIRYPSVRVRLCARPSPSVHNCNRAQTNGCRWRRWTCDAVRGDALPCCCCWRRRIAELYRYWSVRWLIIGRLTVSLYLLPPYTCMTHSSIPCCNRLTHLQKLSAAFELILLYCCVCLAVN